MKTFEQILNEREENFFNTELPANVEGNPSCFCHILDIDKLKLVSYTSWDIGGERLYYSTQEGLVHREPLTLAMERTQDECKDFLDKLSESILEQRVEFY